MISLGRGRHRVIQWSGLRIKRAYGAWLEDEGGKRYLDFFGAAGVNLIGHSHPHVVSRVQEAFAMRGIGAFPGRFEDELKAKLSSVLCSSSLSVELFSGGAEAVEAALRASQEYTGRSGLISFSSGFHGKTMGARSISEDARPPVPHLPVAPYPNCAQCPLHLQWPDCDYACANEVSEIARKANVPVGAVIIEPLQGRAGNIPAPPGYLRRLKEVAKDLNSLLIMDESMTGLGRTGRWFAHYGEDVNADLMIVGKGLGGGYPVSALIGTNDVMQAGSFGEPSGNSSSFGGFATACAAAAATIEVIETNQLVARCHTLGATLMSNLGIKLANCPSIERISGRGFAIGIHLTRTTDQATLLRSFFDNCLQRGLMTMTGGNSIRLYPPLILERHELEKGVDILCEAAWSIHR